MPEQDSGKNAVKSYSPAKVRKTARLPSPSTATWNGSASSPTKAPSGVKFRHARKFGRPSGPSISLPL